MTVSRYCAGVWSVSRTTVSPLAKLTASTASVLPFTLTVKSPAAGEEPESSGSL